MRIDTHTHFYDPTRPEGVPWPPSDDKLLCRKVLPADYRRLVVPHPVAGTVVVEASAWLEDNQWILDLAAQELFIVGFVGHLPVGTDDCRRHLQRFARHPLFRGVRIPFRSLDDPHVAATNFRDLKQLADLDLSLDVLGGKEILPFAEHIAREVPGLRIVIDHLAGVRIDGQAPPSDWVKAVRSVARRSNVYCKVSGLVEGTGRTDGQAPQDLDFYRPVLDTVWSAFGPDRLIYGSNWPVSERFAPLQTVQRIVEEYFEARGRGAVEKVFSKNAAIAYRWVRRTPAQSDP